MSALIEDLGEEELSRVRFGSNRFLKAVGGGLFGLIASRILAAEPAYAATCGSASPCGPSPLCCCCSGENCCSSGCTRRLGECPNGGQCWSVCHFGRIVRCCDWKTAQGEKCICKRTTGQLC
jgi:hypothetical protein